jgi:glycerol-3-phosphate dehydrogenase
MAVEAGDLPRVAGVPDGAYDQLAGRYGYQAHEVLRIAAERPELAGPVVEGYADLLAEPVYAARREQARTVGDALLRRTRLGLTAARPLLGGDAPARVAAAMGPELGWDSAREAAEADAFRDEAAAEGLVVG